MSYNSLLGLGSHSEDANLLCQLLLQETTGTTCDDRSSNSYDGTLSGASNPATATGPTSYLPSAFDMDALDDLITLNTSSLVSGASQRTYLVWLRAIGSATGRFADLGHNNGASTGQQFFLARGGTGNDEIRLGFGGHSVGVGVASWPTNTWIHVGLRVNASASTTGDVDVLKGGVNQSLSDVFGSAQTLNTSLVNKYLGGGDNVGSKSYADCELAEFISFNRALTDAEVAEISSGPEPENTVAPTVSGDTAHGSTLTCSPGTWALPSPFASGSNGTITYAYQWTRDGGDISGATSSTYTTQAADVGTAVGCKVLASNDGGSDSAEETSSSNTITVASAGVTRMNLQLFIPTQS